MDQARRLLDGHVAQRVSDPSTSLSSAGQAGDARAVAGSLRGFPLIDASAVLSSGQSMITDLVYGPDEQVSQIRVLDARTHQVIAECPPDTIARAQREMLAYQDVARAWGRA